MGWANCGSDGAGRPIGYAISARCDHPGCKTKIDRGLAYACGGMHGTGTLGGDNNVDWQASFPSCEQYFCEKHLRSLNLVHDDGAELYSPAYCPKCTLEHEAHYWNDEDFRDLWPTSAARETEAAA